MAYVASAAIVLAAGRGRRLGRHTMRAPKPLLRYDGAPIIETLIERLRDIEIGKIVVVTGYMSESFEYLREKYGVTLIFNPRWGAGNNVLSVHCALAHAKNALIVNGDAIAEPNALERAHEGSCFYADHCPGRSREWALKVGSDRTVRSIDVEGGRNIIRHREASFVCAADYLRFCEQIERAEQNPRMHAEYFEFSLLRAGKVFAKMVPYDAIRDIDTEREWDNDPRAEPGPQA